MKVALVRRSMYMEGYLDAIRNVVNGSHNMYSLGKT